MHTLLFLFSLGALIGASTAAPASGSLVPTLLSRDEQPKDPRLDDQCNYPWLASKQADGVPWTDSKEGDKYFCAAKGGAGRIITGMKIWADTGKLFPFISTTSQIACLLTEAALETRLIPGTLGRINGLQVWFDDGSTSGVIGRMSDKETLNNELSWPAEAKIDELRTWRSTDGGALGRIKLVVGGKLLEVGAQGKKGNIGTPMDLYSGKLVALRGMTNTARDIMTAEFRFLPDIVVSSEVTNMAFVENMDAWNLGKK